MVEADPRRLGERRAEPQRAHVVAGRVERPADRVERRRRQPRDLAQAGVDPEAEHPGVPEAAASEQLGGVTGIGLLDKPRDLEGVPLRTAALDVAVGRGRTARPDAEDHDAAVGRDGGRPLRPPPLKAPASGIRWSDGSTKQRRRRVAPLGDAGGGDDRRQRVARLGLEDGLDPRPRLARLVGDEKARRRRADHDRVGEGPPASRAIVRWNGETPPMIAACCLAKSRRDTGQSRDPAPPQRTAGMTVLVVSSAAEPTKRR